MEELVEDHLHSLVELDRDDQPTRSHEDYVVFFAAPALLGATCALLGVELREVSPLLTGVSVLTGLLFGLLVYTLSLGMTMREGRYPRNSQVAILTDELRANVAWSCAVGLALSTVLALIGSFTRSGHDVNAWLTGLVLGLGAHLGLTLLMVLKRVRSTYKLL